MWWLDVIVVVAACTTVRIISELHGITSSLGFVSLIVYSTTEDTCNYNCALWPIGK